MPMSDIRIFFNGGFKLAVEVVDRSAAPMADRLAAFLHPFFAEDAQAPGEVDLTVVLRDAASFPPDARARCATPLRIRESRAPGFTLSVAVCTDDPDERWAWDAATQVGYRIRPAERRVDLHSGPGGFVHLIELVRYYGLRVEQSRGACVMHASAVIDEARGQVLAIGGPKGAGKTTTMMSLIAAGRHRYFSGDKLLVDIRAGRLVARGWPDFPYVGAGTLRSWPEWARRLGLAGVLDDEHVTARQKFLVDPEDFKRALPFTRTGEAPLGEVVLPEVDYDGPPRSERLPAREAAQALSTEGLFEWPCEFFIGNWHGLVPRDGDGPAQLGQDIARALAALPWTRRDGMAERHA